MKQIGNTKYEIGGNWAISECNMEGLIGQSYIIILTTQI